MISDWCFVFEAKEVVLFCDIDIYSYTNIVKMYLEDIMCSRCRFNQLNEPFDVINNPSL